MEVLIREVPLYCHPDVIQLMIFITANATQDYCFQYKFIMIIRSGLLFSAQIHYDNQATSGRLETLIRSGLQCNSILLLGYTSTLITVKVSASRKCLWSHALEADTWGNQATKVKTLDNAGMGTLATAETASEGI